MYQGLETCRVSSPCPCSCPSGGVVTWQSVVVWVVGGGTRRGGVVSVWCRCGVVWCGVGPFVLKSIKESIENSKYIWRNTKKTKKYLPCAQTTRYASFGPVIVVLACIT